MYVGDGALWLEKKISVDRWVSTAGARRMGTDRNGNLLDRDFSTIPLQSTTMAGYTIKSTEWLALLRYKKYGQKERGKKMSKGEENNNNKSRCVVMEEESEEREKCLICIYIYTRTPALTRRKPLA